MDELLKSVLSKGLVDGVPYVVLAAFTILSAFLGAWFKSRVDSNLIDRTENRKDFQTILAERKAERDAQTAEIKELRGQISTMASRISSLEGRVAQRPFPEWSLSFNGIYTWANLEMATRFLQGKSPDWLIGKTHRDIWPQDIVHVFEKLDAEVRTAHPHMTVMAGVHIRPGELPYIIIKYGQADPNTGAVINFYGMAIPMLTFDRDVVEATLKQPPSDEGLPPQLIAPLS